MLKEISKFCFYVYFVLICMYLFHFIPSKTFKCYMKINRKLKYNKLEARIRKQSDVPADKIQILQ